MTNKKTTLILTIMTSIVLFILTLTQFGKLFELLLPKIENLQYQTSEMGSQYYWFNKLDKEKIEFFGVINEPETDNALPFYHYFDLNTKKLNFLEYIEDEE